MRGGDDGAPTAEDGRQAASSAAAVDRASAAVGRPLDAVAAALVVLLCLSWGFNQVAVKLALPEIPPLIQAAFRSTFGALIVVAWARARGVKLMEPDGSLVPGLIAGALFGLEFLLIYRGLVWTSASRASLFIYTAPFIVVIGARWLLPGDRFDRSQWAGLLLSFAGMVVAFGVPTPGGNPNELIGDLMLVLAGAAWAATTLVIKATRLVQVSYEKTLLYQLIVSAPMLALCAQINRLSAPTVDLLVLPVAVRPAAVPVVTDVQDRDMRLVEHPVAPVVDVAELDPGAVGSGRGGRADDEEAPEEGAALVDGDPGLAGDAPIGGRLAGGDRDTAGVGSRERRCRRAVLEPLHAAADHVHADDLVAAPAPTGGQEPDRDGALDAPVGEPVRDERRHRPVGLERAAPQARPELPVAAQDRDGRVELLRRRAGLACRDAHRGGSGVAELALRMERTTVGVVVEGRAVAVAFARGRGLLLGL